MKGAQPVEPQGDDGPGDPALPGVARVDPQLAARLGAGLKAHGPDYRPRTHHLNPDGSPKFTNRLVLETSPYLLQHAHNPVNWFAWGDAAFERARADHKPILLSIGYSTCHWCHVMERESFEDEEIAEFLNRHFVCIKVDREERPDIDEVYMRAVTLLTGRGGWPLTVLLTPELQPFFGGTYFPPRDGVRGARQGFLSILRATRQAFVEQPNVLLERATELSRRMREAAKPQRPGQVPGPQALVQAAQTLAREFDAAHGGFGRPPKFPQPSRVAFLMRYYRRTRDPAAKRMALETLQHMAAGGMHDQVGGGFHRYSTDGEWLVPHFEKMLYDNAQLASVYLEGFQLTGDPELARVVVLVLDYVLAEMRAPQGGFYSATDADSATPKGHSEEGYFFTWTPAELAAALGEPLAELVANHYGVTESGNFEGRSILHQARPLGEVAKEAGISASAMRRELEAARGRLYAVRSSRPGPGLDGKVLLAWNALMVSAFAQAGLILDREDYVLVAVKAADFLLANLRNSRGRLLRSHNAGRAQHNAYLQDHAFLVQALLDVAQATGQGRFLTEAIAIQAVQDRHFFDAAEGGYFTTSADHEALLTRDKPFRDGALPSGNAISILNLLRLADLTADATYRSRAERCLSAFAVELAKRPASMTSMLAALDHYLDVPLHVVIVKPTNAKGDGKALLDTLRRSYGPNRAVSVLHADEVGPQSKHLPLLTDKVAIGGKATAYVCESGRCELPTSEPKVFARQLQRSEPLLEQGDAPPLRINDTRADPPPYHYDRKTNRHWHPDHRHWHDGPPPKRRG